MDNKKVHIGLYIIIALFVVIMALWSILSAPDRIRCYEPEKVQSLFYYDNTLNIEYLLDGSFIIIEVPENIRKNYLMYSTYNDEYKKAKHYIIREFKHKYTLDYID